MKTINIGEEFTHTLTTTNSKIKVKAIITKIINSTPINNNNYIPNSYEKIICNAKYLFLYHSENFIDCCSIVIDKVLFNSKDVSIEFSNQQLMWIEEEIFNSLN